MPGKKADGASLSERPVPPREYCSTLGAVLAGIASPHPDCYRIKTDQVRKKNLRT